MVKASSDGVISISHGSKSGRVGNQQWHEYKPSGWNMNNRRQKENVSIEAGGSFYAVSSGCRRIAARILYPNISE
jgi:hypothetical protein